MITKDIKKELSINNYIRKASHTNNYWIDFSEGALDRYIKKSTDFNIIIFSEWDNPNYFYTIPYKILKNIFIEKYYSKSVTKQRKRWMGNIINHQLIISNYPAKIDVSKFYLKLPSQAVNILEVISEDIQSQLNENNSSFEGTKQSRLINYYERNAALRTDAIKIHGTVCKACSFDFEKIYGKHGEFYIEVHHLKPLYTLVEETLIDPEKDMTVLCANCHRMIHRKRDNPLSVEELKELLKRTL